jgi:Raf kinase inhibitor-like YbhB/YbcL family protein
MRIMSMAFRNGEHIPRQYTREGEDKSPPLHIEAVPLSAKSLVLILEDPDASRGTFTHWTLFDVDPKRIEVDEDRVPEEARQGKGDGGGAEYGGPKPPWGEPRYFFRLYALDGKRDPPDGSPRQEIERAMKGYVIATAELMGRYAASVPAEAVAT